MLSCASLHKPSLANLSSFIHSFHAVPHSAIPMGSIAPLLFQVQSLALVQTHSSPLESPLSLGVYWGPICAGQHQDIWWLAALSIAQLPGHPPQGTETKLISISLYTSFSDEIGQDKGGFRSSGLSFLCSVGTLDGKDCSLGPRNSVDCSLHYPSHDV